MEYTKFLDKLIIFGLKNYIDKRELSMLKLPYCGETFGSFEKRDEKEIIDREFNKFKIKKQNGLLVLYIKVYPNDTIMMSADTEEELRRNFMRFLVAY